ncbi:SusC/RagA family TonB-linked outer membrane protein [Puteibacter caeruleilacunae]|nr:SusC/RagA family TonB-linked outer membrane protein [Puteibacter caeruleilacunae]
MKKIMRWKTLMHSSTQKLLRIMRISLVLFILSIFQTFALDSFSQQQSVSLNMRESSLEDVLQELEKQTDFNFIYSANSVDLNRTVSISVKDKNVENVLKELFKGTSVKYVFYDNQVILTKAGATSVAASSQKKTISGVVKDEAGESMPGVSVVVKGTTIGITTDLDGKYSISLPADADILVFSFVGMKEQEIEVSGKSEINVTMEVDAIGLQEVVAIGYGTKSRTKLTNSIASVTTEDMQEIPASSPAELLAGRLAGVTVSRSTGTPGISSNIVIRAVGTYQGSTAPAYVIDGVVRDKSSFDLLDANEIESVSILKDAAAAAIYGNRAANGVLLVTTKKGKKGKPVVSFNSTFTTQRPTKIPEMMKGVDIALKAREYNWDGYGALDDAAIEHLKTVNDGYGYDYLNEFYVDPSNQRHAVNVSGGSDRVRYFAGGSFFKEDGFLKPVTYNKYNARASVEIDINDNLTVSANISNVNDKRKKFNFQYGDSDDLKDLWHKMQTWEYFLPVVMDGKYINAGWLGNVGGLIYDSGYWQGRTQAHNAVLSIDYKIPQIKGLSIKGTYSYQNKSFVAQRYFKKHTVYNVAGVIGGNNYSEAYLDGTTSESPSPSREYLSKQHTMDRTYQLSGQVGYTRSFGDHNIDAVFVYEQSEGASEYFYGQRYDFDLLDRDQWSFASSAAEDSRAGGSESETGRNSYVGRINYDYQDKYLLSGSLRVDGSILFPKDGRYGYFPSVSAGWVISKEGFFDVDQINYLKLRASYGEVGSDNTSAFRYQEKYQGSGGYHFGETPTAVKGITYGGIVNPNVTWETAKSMNFGVDFTVGRNLTGAIDIWSKKTEDILVRDVATLPSTVGGNLPDENIGEVKSHGYEVELTYQNRWGDFNYSVGGTFGYAVNEYVKIPQSENAADYAIRKGRSLSHGVGLIADGIYREQSEIDALPKDFTIFGNTPRLGDIKYVDRSGPDGTPDGLISHWDQDVIVKYQVPPYTYGIHLKGDYKGINVDVLFDGAFGHKKFLGNAAFQHPYAWTRIYKYWEDAWSKDNPNGSLPSSDWRRGQNYRMSTHYLVNAGFLRLRNVKIGYALPKSIMSKLNIGKIEFFVSGTNLMQFSKYKGIDVELPRASNYPNMKNYTAGINVQF